LPDITAPRDRYCPCTSDDGAIPRAVASLRSVDALVAHWKKHADDADWKTGMLDLPDDVLGMLERGQLTEGHARAVLAVPDQTERRRLARKIVAQGMSVRAAERAARWSGARRARRSLTDGWSSTEEVSRSTIGSRLRVGAKRHNVRAAYPFPAPGRVSR